MTLTQPIPPTEVEETSTLVLALLSRAGRATSTLSCTRLTGGGNNRAYKITAAQETYLLKRYFRHPDDPRDRLGAEYAFVRFCNTKRIARVPRAVAADPEAGAALYSWVEGAPPQSVVAGDVQEAAAFLNDLAQHSRSPEAIALDWAADACRCAAHHVEHMDKRVTSLYASLCTATSPLETHVKVWLEDTLLPCWRVIKSTLAHDNNIMDPTPLGLEHWLVSPSDFGLHNALRTDNGMVFLDFEYAGRDDPVKTLCDVVCQPAIPFQTDALPVLARAVSVTPPVAQHLLERVYRILPATRVKWCCIMLNEFREVGEARRRFAHTGSYLERQSAQFEKTQKYFDNHLQK